MTVELLYIKLLFLDKSLNTVSFSLLSDTIYKTVSSEILFYTYLHAYMFSNYIIYLGCCNILHVVSPVVILSAR